MNQEDYLTIRPQALHRPCHRAPHECRGSSRASKKRTALERNRFSRKKGPMLFAGGRSRCLGMAAGVIRPPSSKSTPLPIRQLSIIRHGCSVCCALHLHGDVCTYLAERILVPQVMACMFPAPPPLQQRGVRSTSVALLLQVWCLRKVSVIKGALPSTVVRCAWVCVAERYLCRFA